MGTLAVQRLSFMGLIVQENLKYEDTLVDRQISMVYNPSTHEKA